MTFILERNKKAVGLFIHVPKCGGATVQSMFPLAGFTMKRPQSHFSAHLDVKTSLKYVRALNRYTNEEMNQWTMYIPFRIAADWVESSFGFCTYQSAYAGIVLSETSVDEYALSMSDNPSNWAHKKLSSYIKLDIEDIRSIENMKVVMYTTNTLRLLAEKIGYDGNLPHENISNKKHPLKEDLRSLCHDIHYSYRADIFDKLFENGILETTLGSLLV